MLTKTRRTRKPKRERSLQRRKSKDLLPRKLLTINLLPRRLNNSPRVKRRSKLLKKLKLRLPRKLKMLRKRDSELKKRRKHLKRRELLTK